MYGAGVLRNPGRRNQRLPPMPHQLHHQRHPILLRGDIPPVNSVERLSRRCGIDAHELGKNDVWPDMLDKIGAQGPVGQPLHRRQHQRCSSRLPREYGHIVLTVSGTF